MFLLQNCFHLFTKHVENYTNSVHCISTYGNTESTADNIKKHRYTSPTSAHCWFNVADGGPTVSRRRPAISDLTQQ